MRRRERYGTRRRCTGLPGIGRAAVARPTPTRLWLPLERDHHERSDRHRSRRVGRAGARIIAADFDTEHEVHAAISVFEKSVPHPEVMGLISYWHRDFREEPTSEQIVDRALSYRAIDL